MAAPDPAQPLADAEAQERSRRDLKAEALSIQHLMTHWPKNPYCWVCQQAKAVNVPHRRGAMAKNGKPPIKFGQAVTMGTIVARGDSKGVDGETDCLMV